MSFDFAIWESVLLRVETQLDTVEHSKYVTTLFYSFDMDQYMAADNPVDVPETTVLQELHKMGVRTFVRLPFSTGLTNYLQVEQNNSVIGKSGSRGHLGG